MTLETSKTEANRLFTHAMESFLAIDKGAVGKELSLRDGLLFAQLSASLATAHYLKLLLEKETP